MRIRIAHETTFGFAPPSRSTIMNLRLTPRSFDSQYVLRWRVSVDLDCALRSSQDSLGNVVNAFSYQKPVERLTVAAIGEVETTDAVGVVRGAEEPLPAAMFLRESAKAVANASVRAFAAEAVAGGSDTLDKLHRLMQMVHEHIKLEAGAAAGGGVAETLALKAGAAVDLAHLFIAAARAEEIPARFVTGFVAPEAGPAEGLAVWAEAAAPGLGWVGFDCARNVCPNDRYVRLAVGFDEASAQPFRVSPSATEETARVTITTQGASGQGQSQRIG